MKASNTYLFCDENRHNSIAINSRKKSLKIPKGKSESVYRRTDNTMANI